MTNELKIFESQDFGKVRVIMKDNEPWFVGKDVTSILGYSNGRKALLDHVDDEDKSDGVTIRDTIGRNQNPVMINEAGLYSLVLCSKLPAAKKFKHWVTSEVLPSIRKNGAYIAGQEQMTDAELVAKALVAANNIIAEREKRIATMTAKLAEQNRAITAMIPKAEYHDRVLAADGTMLTTVIAKEYGMSGAKLNNLLHDLHVQYKIGGTWVLYSEHQEKNYQKTETITIQTPRGEYSKVSTRWTQEGRRFIYDTLKANGIMPLGMRS